MNIPRGLQSTGQGQRIAPGKSDTGWRIVERGLP